MLSPEFHITIGQLMSAPCLTGTTVFLLVLQLQELWCCAGMGSGKEWEFEEIRRRRLRNGIRGFAVLEPLIANLRHMSWLKRLPLDDAEKALRRRATAIPWATEEFAAYAVIITTAFAFVVAILTGALVSPVAGAGTGVFVLLFGIRAQFQQLRNDAEERVRQVRQRLTFAVDLMAMTMQAGAGLTDALKATITDSPEHPLSQELRQILEDYRRGLSFEEAFSGMDQRMQHEEVQEFIRSIVTSKRLGTPVAEIFTSLAAQMRLKKLQGAESAAGEAQVCMQGPMLVIMVACMLVAVFPFIFQLWNHW
jgi:Flp pilus assembly protein TadB